MAIGAYQRVVRELRRTSLGAELADGALLDRFVRERDQEAFASLVRRHGPMVLGVCRRVVGNLHDAEDAYQAAFLVLACKANVVRPPERLASWLWGVAYRTALKARGRNMKRTLREGPLSAACEPAIEPKDSWQDVRDLLDEEIGRLPEIYRLPVVLCELEGRSRKEASQELHLAEGTLSSRLATAREKLARRLRNRGLALSAAGLATLLAVAPLQATVSPALMSASVQAATAGTSGAAALFSPEIVSLFEGVMKTMFLAKLKTSFALLALIGALSLGGLGLSTSFGRPGSTPDRQAVPAQALQEDSLLAFVQEELLADDAEAQKRRPQAPKGDTKQGQLKAVDAAKQTITIAQPKRGEPATEETLKLAKDLTVYVDRAESKLADLKPGAQVMVVLNKDSKEVTAIRALTARLIDQTIGEIKKIDAAKNTITIALGAGRGKPAVEETVTLAKNVTIMMNREEAKLADLKPGQMAAFKFSENPKEVTAIQGRSADAGGVQRRIPTGKIKSVDAAKSTLTVLVRDRNAAEGKEEALTLAKNVKVFIGQEESNTAALKADQVITWRLSADNKEVVEVRLPGKRTRE